MLLYLRHVKKCEVAIRYYPVLLDTLFILFTIYPLSITP